MTLIDFYTQNGYDLFILPIVHFDNKIISKIPSLEQKTFKKEYILNTIDNLQNVSKIIYKKYKFNTQIDLLSFRTYKYHTGVIFTLYE